MFVAAITNPTAWWQHLGFNWFDVALVGLLIFGFWRGRKRGMTKELMPTSQWLLILLAAGLGHSLLADWLEQRGYIRQVFGHQFNERTAALMTAYLAICIAIMLIFTLLKQKLNAKLEGSNFFGSNEYYLGVVAGLLRYVCLLLVALALLNAPIYTTGDIEASKAYNNRWYGGGLKDYNGDFIPTVYEVQDTVFKKSFLGPLIKQNLSVLLINSTASAKQQARF
jgi:uncharacterized membrane protein required for colicin V production